MVVAVGSSIAAIIAAIGSAIAATLGGVALVIGASNRRTAKATHKEVRTMNGRTLAETVDRIEADLAEHLRSHG